MIDAAEIRELAGDLSLEPQVVEKDYVLGWVLAGIGCHPETGRSWIFKGGTCLKKVHFETYRFSEDLDFTVTEEGHLDEGTLNHLFSEIAEWIYEECGIEIPADQLRFEVYRNARGGLSAEGRVYYRGPLQPRGSLPRIKLDLTVDELVSLEPARQRITHSYSDEPPEGIWVQGYPFAEVFAEKIRALGERGRPRDLYDVINLFRRDEARGLAGNVRDVLRDKCRHKSVVFPTLAGVQKSRAELEGEWANMLRHQLPTLPPFEVFWAELARFFAWLETREEAPAVSQYRLGAGEEVIRVGAGGLGGLGLPARPLETIRFAAANHLCVDLDYRDEQGRRSTRRIEPYSLRRTRSGDVVLHAERTEGGGHRSYRVDRILGAEVASQVFSPRFRVELTPLGYQPVPEEPPRTTRPRAPRPAGRRRRARVSGPRYVYQCGLCRRKFTRRRSDSRLRPHKDKRGYPCAGRTGIFVTVRY